MNFVFTFSSFVSAPLSPRRWHLAIDSGVLVVGHREIQLVKERRECDVIMHWECMTYCVRCDLQMSKTKFICRTNLPCNSKISLRFGSGRHGSATSEMSPSSHWSYVRWKRLSTVMEGSSAMNHEMHLGNE